MAHKYLNDIGIEVSDDFKYFVRCLNGEQVNDGRWEKWKGERETYGFDSRETWDLSYVFHLWLYEHLMMFKEHAAEVVDLDFHKFKFENVEYTQLELIDLMLKRLRFRFSAECDEFNEEHLKIIKSITEIWSLVHMAMWW